MEHLLSLGLLRNLEMEVENAISVNPAGLGNKVDCAVEDPQEFV
jgi:hypothetical protein